MCMCVYLAHEIVVLLSCNGDSFFERIRDSTRKRIDEIQWQKHPTTASAKDQERKLCSGSGIQSLSSPLIPNMMTAIVQNSPAGKTKGWVSVESAGHVCRRLCTGRNASQWDNVFQWQTVSCVVYSFLSCRNSPDKNMMKERILMTKASRLVMKHSSMARVPMTATSRNTKPSV